MPNADIKSWYRNQTTNMCCSGKRSPETFLNGNLLVRFANPITEAQRGSGWGRSGECNAPDARASKSQDPLNNTNIRFSLGFIAKSRSWPRKDWSVCPRSSSYFASSTDRMQVCMSDELAEMFHACRKAAEQGYARAQYSLGLKYYNGEGVSQNQSVAKQK